MDNKSWYLKKKIWVGILTGVAASAAYISGIPELSQYITGIGMAIIAAIGLEDLGKAAK